MLDALEKLSAVDYHRAVKAANYYLSNPDVIPKIHIPINQCLFLLGRNRLERMLLASIIVVYLQGRWVIKSVLNSQWQSPIRPNNVLYKVIHEIPLRSTYSWLSTGVYPSEILTPVGEEFACLLRLIFTVGYPAVKSYVKIPPDVPPPSVREARVGIYRMREYASAQANYKPAVDYLEDISDELATFIWHCRRALLHVYGLETGEILTWTPSKCDTTPILGMTFDFGEVIKIDGKPNARPKDLLLQFVEEVMQYVRPP